MKDLKLPEVIQELVLYIDSAGLLMAYKAGINPKIIRRPIQTVLIS